MTSRLELQHRYPEPPERMRAVLTDPAYLRDKLNTVGGPLAELVSREEDDSGTTIVLRQAVPASMLPSIVRSLLPGDLVIRRTETWRSCDGDVHAAVEGAPGTIAGKMSLGPDPAGSLLTLQLEAEVPVPLIGRKLEKAITDSVSKLMATEYEFTVSWLGRPATP